MKKYDKMTALHHGGENIKFSVPEQGKLEISWTEEASEKLATSLEELALNIREDLNDS